MKRNTIRRSPEAENSVRAPSHAEIAARAQALWRQMGCPDSRDEEIWLEAERQLRRPHLSSRADWSDEGPEERMDELEAIYPDPSTSKETTSL
jgi:hypothetical protein